MMSFLKYREILVLSLLSFEGAPSISHGGAKSSYLHQL